MAKARNNGGKTPDTNAGKTGGNTKVKGIAGALGMAALTLSGLIVLPSDVLQSIGNALFPFLNEDDRTAAVACSSLSCCCCSVLLACCLMAMAMKG